MRGKRQSGFTLTELLITMVVIGILAAVAIPSYSAYVTRGQRSAAKVALQQAAQFLERNYTTNGCYQYATAAACTAQAGTQVVLPFTGAPTGGAQTTYALTVNFTSAQAFQLAAAPCGMGGACTGSYNASFTDPTCGALLLDNTGQQSVDTTGAGTWPASPPPAALLSSCWQR